MSALRQALSAASCSLLAVTSQSVAAKQWQVSASGLLYREANRVTVNEDVVSFRGNLDDQDTLSGTFTMDTMSGASPTGAVDSGTYTSPSGSAYTIPSGQTPMHRFEDLRLAAQGEWERQWDRRLRSRGQLYYSEEYDYRSLGLGGEVLRDFNRRNTTVSAAFNAYYDTIQPVGGVPAGLSPLGQGQGYGSDYKQTLEARAGLNQILGRNTVMDARLSLGNSSGYLSDPYKLISFVDANSGVALDHYHERRPDRRTYLSVAGELRHIAVTDDVAVLSFRHYRDDWGVVANTVEASLDHPLKPRQGLVFKVRLHSQQAADFYHYRLVDDTPSATSLPGVRASDRVGDPTQLYAASADYRLGELNTVTVGARYQRPLPWKQGRLTLRVARMQQTDKRGLFDTLRAWIAQAVFSARF